MTASSESGYEKPMLVDGCVFDDERGQLSFANDVSLKSIQRFYLISNKSTTFIRAWQAHKIEAKYFYVVEGSFLIATVKLDDFANPSPDLVATHVELNAGFPQVLIVPPGYANGIRALTQKNKLLVFSTLSLQESSIDTFRFSADLWFDWGINP